MISKMTQLLETRGLTVELPTPAGWVLLVNEVSLQIILDLCSLISTCATILALKFSPVPVRTSIKHL